MWMSRSVGIRVFPTKVSEKILASPSLIHYQMPTPPESPAEYDIDGDTIQARDVSLYRSGSHQVGMSSPDIKRRSSYSQYPYESQTQHRSCPMRSHTISAASSDWKSRKHCSSQTDQITSLPSERRRGYSVGDNDGDETGLEILQDLDKALDRDEHITIRHFAEKRMNLASAEFLPHTTVFLDPDDDCYYLQALDDRYYREVPESDCEIYMETGNGNGNDFDSDRPAPVMNEAIISELRMMSNGINSLSGYKEGKRKEMEEKYKQVLSAIETVKKEYTPQMFVDRTPTHFKESNAEIPEWKRLLMAKKIAAEEIKQKEDELWKEFTQWKEQFKPSFRRSIAE